MSTNRTFLAFLVLVALAFGGYLSLQESARLSAARRALPAACIADLLAMSEKDAVTRGVSLWECRRKQPPRDFKAESKGRYVYGPGESPVDGMLVLVETRLKDGTPANSLIHVQVNNSYLFLNDIFAAGSGCRGGVADVRLEGDTMGHVINMTPQGIMRFGSYMPGAPVKDGDLGDGEQDCYGKLVFKDRFPVVLQLAPEARLAADETGRRPRQQDCFDNLVARYYKQGKTALQFPQDYENFRRDYDSICGAP